MFCLLLQEGHVKLVVQLIESSWCVSNECHHCSVHLAQNREERVKISLCDVVGESVPEGTLRHFDDRFFQLCARAHRLPRASEATACLSLGSLATEPSPC